ncbi:hypothetical protein OAT77_04690 [Alphaproteobacteria bacterium]|nr:hypothetical protein [Alphaproteobacteria bacterium]
MSRRKHPGKPHKRAEGQYLLLPYAMIKHPSFKALSASAVRVLIEMSLGFHGHNNGHIVLSTRQAEKCLRSGKAKAARALDQLQEYGFIVCHFKGSFHLKTKQASEWEITFHPMLDRPPSHAWKKIK